MGLLNSSQFPEIHPAISQGCRLMLNRRAFLQRNNEYSARICVFRKIPRGQPPMSLTFRRSSGGRPSWNIRYYRVDSREEIRIHRNSPPSYFVRRGELNQYGYLKIGFVGARIGKRHPSAGCFGNSLRNSLHAPPFSACILASVAFPPRNLPR